MRRTWTRVTVFAAIVSALVFALAGRTGAGNAEWTTGGPNGGPVIQLVRDPLSGTLFAATNGGVWRSSDSGASWSRSGNYADLNKVNAAKALATSTAESPLSTTLYAASEHNIIKSTNGGDSWSRSGTIHNLPSTSAFKTAQAVAASDTKPATVYSGWSDGILVSTDDANNWHIKNSGLPRSKSISKMAVKPNSASTAFALVIGEGIYRTQDTGASWSKVGPMLAYSSTDPDEIFIDQTDGTLYVIFDRQLFYSGNDGETWSWKYMPNASITNCRAIAVDHTRDPKVVAVGCREGIVRFYQEPGGAYYGPVLGRSMNNGVINDILFAEDKFYIAASPGILRANSGTITEDAAWVPLNEGLLASVVYSVSLDPSDPNNVLAGADFTDVYRSADGGASWSSSRNGLAGSTDGSTRASGNYEIARDPTNPQKVYAATREGLFFSSNGGANWTAAVSNRAFASVTVSPNGTAYAGTRGFVYWGTGTNFASSEVKTPYGIYATVSSIAVDPATPDSIYAGTYDDGMFRSRNAGDSWIQVWDTHKDMTALAVDNSTSPSTVYVATPVGPYKSTDRGATWVSANRDMNPMSDGQALAVHVNGNSSVVFFGNHDGIAYSTNHAGSWHWTMDQPPSGEILDIDLSPSGQRLYVGTNGGGVYQYENFRPSTADVTPPVTRIALSSQPNGNGWFSSAPRITLSSNETGPIKYQWDSSSGRWSSYSSPVTAPTGLHILYFHSSDSAGNTEGVRSQVFRVDLVSPSVSGFSPPAYSARQSKTTTVNLKWRGADNAGGSGIKGYDIRFKSGASGTWRTYRSDIGTAGSSFTGGTGSTYYLRIRARDRAGRTGYSATKSVIIPADDRSAKYSSGWTSANSSSSPRYLGTTRFTKRKGKWASYTFKGTAVTLMFTKGPGRGKAAVYVDGRYITTIDTYASSTRYRQLYWIKSTKLGWHTVKLVTKGTKGRPKVELDGIAVKK